MIEFKQIVGRGTRLFDDKDYFTIYDFVRAYEHFNDPEWDGEPVEPPTRVSADADGIRPSASPPAGVADDQGGVAPERPAMIKIKLADGKERNIQHMMATTFWSPEGKPISAAEFIERLFGELPELFKNEDDLRALWSRPDTRKGLLEGLAEKGYGDEQLVQIRRLIDADKSDLYDVLAYIAFASPPLSRAERANLHRHEVYAAYDDRQREFLDFVLDQYVDEGVQELDNDKLPDLLLLKYHAFPDAVEQLGSLQDIRKVFMGFQRHLYVRQAA